MKKITKELPSLRKSVRIIGDLISDEKYDLPLAVMNELLDYKDTLEDFDLAYNVECSTGIHFFKTIKEAEECVL